MSGLSFLKFLKDKEYIPEITAKKYENPDLNVVVGGMFKTDLLNETDLVGYLNEWGEVPVTIEEKGNARITLVSDVIERHSELENYFITPINLRTANQTSDLEGGIIEFVIPFKYHDYIRTDLIRNALKPVYQTSAWKINVVYALEDVCTTLYYQYAVKFLDSSLTAVSNLNLKQKIQKVFRDSVRSGTMDIVFHSKDGKMSILRKYMNEYHPYNGVKFTKEELYNFKTMMVGTIGEVEGIKINSEPSLDFKIENLNEDGLYEGRVNFMQTKMGFEFHVRIIKLTFNEMTYADYFMPPDVKRELVDSLKSSTGLIIVTGSRGSGKQVFMYSSINEFRKLRPDSFIETLEDPVEARLDGEIAQIEIDIANGRDFAYYLRGIKRHSTNLYMIGELRDKETAEAVLTEAASGALVITTTHCSDSAGIFKKMSVELKGDDATLMKLVNEFRVVTHLTMTRKACPKCSTLVSREQLTESERLFIDSWNYKGKIHKQNPSGNGCDHCRQMNYKKINKLESDGNIYEPLIITEALDFDREVKEIIGRTESILEQEKSIRERMIKKGRYKTQMALSLVHYNKLTLEECMRHFTRNTYCEI